MHEMEPVFGVITIMLGNEDVTSLDVFKRLQQQDRSLLYDKGLMTVSQYSRLTRLRKEAFATAGTCRCSSKGNNVVNNYYCELLLAVVNCDCELQ